MAVTDLAITDALAAIQELFDVDTGRTLGPQIIDPKTMPQPSMHKEYSIDLSSSRNQKLYRDTGRIRMEHTACIGLMVPLVMNDQYSSYLTGIDTEQRFIEAAGLQQSFAPVRLQYSTTKRTILPSHEYVVIQIYFTFQHNLGRMAT